MHSEERTGIISRKPRNFKGIPFFKASGKGRLRRGAVYLKTAPGARVNTFATVTNSLTKLIGLVMR